MHLTGLSVHALHDSERLELIAQIADNTAALLETSYRSGRIYNKEFSNADAAVFPACQKMDPDRETGGEADVFPEVREGPGGADDAGRNFRRKRGQCL